MISEYLLQYRKDIKFDCISCVRQLVLYIISINNLKDFSETAGR